MPDWIAPDTLALHARARPRKLACVDLATGRRWTYSQFDWAVERAACARPRKLACVDLATGRRWTYSQFDWAVERAACALAEHYGVAEGRRVAALARNSADLLILQQATMRLGAIFVPLNWRLSPSEQERILRDCSP